MSLCVFSVDPCDALISDTELHRGAQRSTEASVSVPVVKEDNFTRIKGQSKKWTTDQRVSLRTVTDDGTNNLSSQSVFFP